MQFNDELKIISGIEIEPREVSWLWYPYIPFGKVTIVQGDPGEGKSTFVLNLAAMLTRGWHSSLLRRRTSANECYLSEYRR